MSAKTANTGERAVTLDVSLLGREYKVACKPGEEGELRDAIAFLERRMRDIREAAKTSSTERIAVMTALNLVHEFQRARTQPSAEVEAGAAPAVVDAADARRRIVSMRSAIDQVLAASQEKLL